MNTTMPFLSIGQTISVDVGLEINTPARKNRGEKEEEKKDELRQTRRDASTPSLTGATLCDRHTGTQGAPRRHGGRERDGEDG